MLLVAPGDHEAIAAATKALQGAPSVGLDTEWRPVMVRGQPEGVALLQIATRDRVFLFDLLSGLDPGVEALLGEVLRCPGTIVVGYGIQGDCGPCYWMICYKPVILPGERLVRGS